MNRLLSSFFLSLCLFFFFSLFLFYIKFVFGSLFFIDIFHFNWMNIKFFFLYDSISSFFVILSLFLLLICIFISWYLSYYSFIYYFCIIFCMSCLFNIFLTIDIFILFCFFEAIVMPLFLIVGVWGSRDRKF